MPKEQIKTPRHLRERPDLVYETTNWQRYLYEDARQDLDLAAVEAKGVQRFGAFPAFTRETFARMYAPAVDKLDEPDTATQWAQDAHEAAEALPDWQRLVKRTRGDQFNSSVAATFLSNAVLDVLPGEQREDPQRLREDLEALDGETFPGVEKVRAKIEDLLAKTEKQGERAAEKVDPTKLRNAVRAACEEATEQIDQIDALVSSFGEGDGNASKTGTVKAKAELARRIQNNDKLRRIAEIAGRLRRIAQRKQRAKDEFARDEVADVEIGSDLSRLLPTELARLADPDLELSFLRDFAERRLLQYRLTGKEEQGKGPIVLCLDESSSMSGDREIWCKGVFLALMEIAKRQRRACALIHFCSKVSRVDVFRPGKFSTAEVLDAADHFTGGGTSFEAPLAAAKEVIEQTGGFQKADVVFVTDGSAAPVGPWWDEYRKQKEIACYGIAVAGGGSSALDAITDEVLDVQRIAKASDGEKEVANKLFSL